MLRLRLTLPDAIASALVLFLALWAYEASNVIVLVWQGFDVSLNFLGPLPLGVAGSSMASISPWTKVLQVGIALGMVLPLGVVLSRRKLPAAKAFWIATVGVYLASVYWEMFSSLSMVSMDIHTDIYLVGTGTITLVLLRKLGRPLRLWYEPGHAPTR